MKGKESIPAQFFKAILVPEEEYGLEKSLTIYKKYSDMSADVPNHSPHAGKKRSCQQLHD